MLAEQMLMDHMQNFTYSDATITVAAKGKEFDEFKQQFEDSERCYGYMRFRTGDEMSKRTKFILITWIGKDVGVMQRAKVTNDKSLMKQVITNYAAEFQLECISEIDENYFKDELHKIGGTKYGTGVKM
ncbi:hypothetical protein RUM44_002367 [Polyplax serrata]|uniref:ADF-H domain-containing protein n=1 Tax=Polyplax serrata TaxID=468196 RepID=A0ABR1AMN0_POLSC